MVDKGEKAEYMEQIREMYSEDVEIVREDSQNSLRQSEQDFQDMVEEEQKRKEVLQEQMKKDMRYMVVDKDTGEVFNINEENHQYDQSTNKRTLDNWKEYWEKVHQVNRLFLESVENNDINLLTQLLGGGGGEFPLKINQKVNVDEQTSLHVSCEDGNIGVVRLLLSNQVDLNLTDRRGQNALHLLCRTGHLQLANLLIQNNINSAKQDNNLNTPLHIATLYGHQSIITLLFKQPIVDITLLNKDNKRAVDLTTDSLLIQLFTNKGQKYYDPARKISDDNLQNQTMSNEKSQGVINQLIVKKDKRGLGNKIKRVLYKMVGKKIQGDQEDTLCMQSFTFYKKLGQGSFGEVYLVRYKTDGQLYAMKILQKKKVQQNNQLRFAMTEKTVLQIMSHPLIVKLNYAFQTKNKLVMVMDYCPKGDLCKLLRHYKKIPETFARIYIGEILLAIECLHQSAIIFRDLKPENVVLDQEGHAMLTDFGLSKQGVKDNISRTFCGSLAYLAPEMLFRQGHSRMVDWYLLGVLLYELVIGATPYFSNNKEQLFNNIKTMPLVLPNSLSKECKSLIKGLMNRNPSRRLGVDNDGQDIREHPWFHGIDWNKVYDKQYTVLPNDYIQSDKNLMVDEQMQKQNQDKKDRNKIDNWTFIIEEKQNKEQI